MRTSTARLSLAAAGLAVLGLVGSSSAASRPTTLVVTDPSGDGKKAPGDDLTRLTYTTTGVTKMVGRTLVYTPKRLVVTLTTAGAAATNGTVQYNLEGTLPGCGDFYLYAAPGAVLDKELGGRDYVYGQCSSTADATSLESTDFDTASVAVKGSNVVFTVPFGSAPGFRAGAVISHLFAYTGTVEPVRGSFGPVVDGAKPLDGAPGVGGTSVANDDLTSTRSYKIG